MSEALWGAYEGARGGRSSIAYPTKVGMENMSMHTETANPFFSASAWPSGPGPGSTEPAGSGSGEPHWPSLQSVAIDGAVVTHVTKNEAPGILSLRGSSHFWLALFKFFLSASGTIN